MTPKSLSLLLVAALVSATALAAAPKPKARHLPPPPPEAGEETDPAELQPLPDYRTDPSFVWCGDVLRILDLAQGEAVSAMYRGEYKIANERLLGGLSEAGEAAASHRSSIQPLTARAIRRGAVLANAVGGAVSGELSEVRTMTHFLLAYYGFVRSVARDMDMPMWIPYRFCEHRRCESEVDLDDFERRFVEYAKSQVQLILDQLALGSATGGYLVPVGAYPAYQKALQLTTQYAVQDLRQSLWSNHFACATRELSRVSGKLACFKEGSASGSYRGDPVEMVNASAFEAQDALNQVGSGLSACHESRRSEGGSRSRHGREEVEGAE